MMICNTTWNKEEEWGSNEFWIYKTKYKVNGRHLFESKVDMNGMI